MHAGQNTKNTDKTAATLFDYKRGGGGERKEKADIICVAEEMICKIKVNMNVLANINYDKTFETGFRHSKLAF